MTTYFEKKAAAGARWMDKKLPGWHRQVNPKSLDIGIDDSCILGQCFGSFNTERKKLKLNQQQSINLGFYCKHKKLNNWVKLTKAWVNEIIIRRLAKAA